MATAQDFIKVARAQVGYKESPPNSNKTKFGAWYGLDGQPWCDMFVSWCADQCGALGVVGKFAYTPAHANFFKTRGQWLDREEKPQPGDIVFFSNKTRICHVGIVTARNGTVSVDTIEGNTSVTSNDNGGAVMARTRTYGAKGSNWYIAGFGRPQWSTPAPTPTPAPSGKESIKEVQRWVNSYAGANIAVDGINGPQTRKGCIMALQTALNSLGARLAVDGIFGARTRAAVRNVKRGSRGMHVKALQAFLICLGYDTGGFDGIAGAKTDAAIRAYQRAHGLSVDGIAGKATFAALAAG